MDRTQLQYVVYEYELRIANPEFKNINPLWQESKHYYGVDAMNAEKSGQEKDILLTKNSWKHQDDV